MCLLVEIFAWISVFIYDNFDLIENSGRSDECILDCPMNDSDIPQFELSGSDPSLQLSSVIIINIEGLMSLQSHKNRPNPLTDGFKISFFIRPESDHCLPLTLTH